MLKAVIFDMDGVILDSETISWKTWILAGKEKNVTITEPLQQKCTGLNRNDTILTLKNHFGQDFDALSFLNRTSELFYKIEAEEGIPLKFYAKEALSGLKKRYKIALASSTRAVSVHRQMKNAGVFDLFEKIITGDMVEHSKPDPEIYLKACSAIGVSPEECVAVEDSPNGIKSAKAAGLKPIMVPDKIAPYPEIEKLCWKICTDLKEVTDLLLNL